MHSRSTPCAIALTLLLTVGTALGQTITVDITSDIVDVDPNTATVADLPGPDGHISFSEAMIASNNTPGRQTIGFAIPQSEWTYLPWYYPGRAVLNGPMNYAIAYDEVTIDGTTQTSFTGDTNPDGWEVVILRAGGLHFPADNCRVTGLDRTPIHFEGSNGVVENNTEMGVEFSGFSGGSAGLVKDCTAGYVRITGSDDNVVVGSTIGQLRLSGRNNRIGGPTPAERNHILGSGTWTSQGYPTGFALGIANSTGTLIENNWIGLSPDGLSQGHPSSMMGIYFDAENNDTTIRNNRIGGILAWVYPRHSSAYQVGSAIQIYGSGSGVRIVGNKIGLDANDEPTLGSIDGIATVHFFYPNGVQNVVIGGPNPGEGNEIAGHIRSGITVANTYSEVRISGNSIHDNGALGIDLITDDFLSGVTLNDPLDVDAGGNGLQNFPVILSATSNGQAIHLAGELHSEPLSGYTLEFFASPAADPSGFGEGQMYLGSTSATTDAAGDAAFDVVLAGTVPQGWVVAATATLEPIGATSEFSACVPVESEFTEITSDSLNVWRGRLVSGTLSDTFASDDSYLRFRPGFVLSNSEPPVWLEFAGTLPTDVPSSLSVTLEGKANTVGLRQTIEMFNWTSGRYEPVDSRAASSNVDTTVAVDLTASIASYVQAGTGKVKSRMGWRATGPVLVSPWTVSIDRVVWTVR